MVLHNSGLREYIQPVLTCLGSESLLAAINLCYQCNSEWIVVVDPQQRPQGCIALSRLSGLLLDSVPVSVGAMLTADFSQASRTSVQMVLPELATGIITVSEDLTLLDVLPFLQHRIPFTVLAVVNSKDEFLGLVDEHSILRQLSVYIGQSTNKSAVPPKVSESKRSALNSHQSQVTQLTQQLLAQKSEFELRLRSQQQIIEYLLKHSTLIPLQDPERVGKGPLMLVTETQGIVPLLPMQALLEYLPLPFMLQTSDGEVVVQNAIWRQEFEELRDPVAIRRDAAYVLAESATPSADEAAQVSWCEVGSQPNSCICACPLKDGRERIIQFVKVRLGCLVPLESHPTASTDSTEAHQPVPNHFRLANLDPETGDTADAFSDPQDSLHASQEKTRGFQADQQLWLVFAQDITEQYRLARDLTAKNADLVQLNRLKDEFLACISHELRTPLTAVLGLSTLLSDQSLGPLNTKQAHYAHLIHQSGRHLMAVVNDIMDLARIETGQLTLSFDRVDLKTICEQAFERTRKKQTLEQTPDRQEPGVTLEIEPGLTEIVADELRLRQMLENLLSNAFKFTEVTHSIGLKVSRWGGWIAFTVWDTGIGIPNDQQHLIFQKFQQVESPLTRRFEGTGLGLALTQRLARLHGGDISFLSQEGKGSQFTILLPPHPPAEIPLSKYEYKRALPPELIQAEATAPASKDRNRMALIVEAVPRFIEQLSTHLINLGYRVVVARSGTEALEKARRLQPCLIFLNPLLPMLSGWDVLTLLKTSADSQAIPVVVTATPVDEEQAYRCDANGFLQLPIQLDRLRHVMGQVLARQSEAILQAQPPPRPLTLLKLNLINLNHDFTPVDFNEVLQGYHYRLLEADDLEQAELLGRVWDPNLILLDGSPPDWLTFLQQLRTHTMLASRPLVTLDGLAQSAAYQIPGITVFTRPNLSESNQRLEPSDIRHDWLRLIQLAIGYTWQPVILTVDSALWSEQDSQLQREQLCETEWGHALIQYLLTAGLRGHMGESKKEAVALLQSGTVDLLLVSWTDDCLDAAMDEIAQILNQLPHRPPILVLDHRSYGVSTSDPPASLESALGMDDRILPSTLPMAELLDIMQTLLSQAKSLAREDGSASSTHPGQIQPDP